MLKKKLMILTIILVSLFAISVVSAADNTTSDIVSVEETTDEVVSVENDNQVVESVDNQIENLSANPEGTFTDLANDIANANGELKLTKNYVYDSSKDSNYKNGITINKEITINGRGFVINGENQARAFNVAYGNVILRNIEFINCSVSGSNGGAVYWSGANGSLFDCDFINCHGSGSSYGGAVYWSGANGSLFDCSFVDCYYSSSSSSSYGGAVYWSGANGSLFDCDFIRCISSSSISTSSSSSTAYSYGGAVYWSGANGDISNCSFEDCHSSCSCSCSYSYSSSSSSSISDSSSSSSYVYGGAVYMNGVESSIVNCDFINCYSYSYSYNKINVKNTYWGYSISSSSSSSSSSYGSVYWQGNNGNLFDCNFINSSSSFSSSSESQSNSASYVKSSSSSTSYGYGGAVYWNGRGGNLHDCNFITPNSRPSSSKSGSGGAVYWYGTNGNILNSSFTNCHIPNGGYANAIYWYGNDGSLLNCSFINSTSSSTTGYNGTVYWNGVNGNMFNSSFDGNYYDYEKYCRKATQSTVYPVISIQTSTLKNDNRIVIFESTQLVNNISASLYNVTDRKILYDEFNISSEDLSSSYTVNNLEESEYQIYLRYNGDNFYTATSENNFFKIGKNSSYEVTIGDAVIGEGVTLNLTLNEDATGTVKLTLSNYTFINELVDGKVSFYIPDVSSIVNRYQIKYVGDDNYNPIYINDTFNALFKSDICLNLNETYILDEKIPLEYNITPNCTGTISIFADNIFKADILVGEAFELENIDAGEHIITVIYNGDEYFSTSNASQKITVNKWDTQITTDNYIFDYGDNLVIEAEVNDDDATGNITLFINNAEYIANIINKKAIFNIPTLNAGTYEFTVRYEGNQYYNSKNTTAFITINKLSNFNMNVTYFPAEIRYGDQISLNVTFNENQTGIVSFDLDGVTYAEDVIDGKATFALNKLNVGRYSVVLMYSGDRNYEPKNATVDLKVNKALTIISAQNVSVVYGDESGELVATLTNAYGNALNGANVRVSLNGRDYALKTDSKGQIKLSIMNLTPGRYVAAIYYNGNNKYNQSNATAEVIVNKLDTVIVAPDVSVIYNVESKELIATLTNAATGKALNSANMLVNLDGVDYALKTNSKGQVKVSTNNLTPGIYEAFISYKGNNKFNPSNATSTITVNNKVDTSISIVYDMNSKELIATLTNVDTGKGLVTANVVVNLDGVDYALKTNSKGQIKVSTADLASGSYTATISYKGNSKYNPSNATATFIVINKIDTAISVDYDAESKEVVATLTNVDTGKGLVTANVVVNLNGVDYALKTNSKGQVKVSAANLTLGSYIVSAYYKGNSKFNPSNATANIVVKNSVILSAPDVSIEYGDDSSEFVATLTNAEGKALTSANVVVTLDGVDYALKTNSKGQVKVSLANMTLGTYAATVSYKGNTKYAPATATATVYVTKKATNISAVYDAESNQLVATLTNGEGKALNSANVVVNLNGMDYTLKTNSKGQVKVSTSDFEDGIYSAFISYKGNSKYSPSNATATFIVSNKMDTSISAVYNLDAKELVATLTNSEGNAVGNVNIVININGMDYSLKTNSIGQAKFSTSYFPAGFYTTIISFNGNNDYNPSSTTASIVIQ